MSDLIPVPRSQAAAGDWTEVARDPFVVLVAAIHPRSTCTLGGDCKGTGRTSWGWPCACKAGDVLRELEYQYRRSLDDTDGPCCEEHFPSFAMTVEEQVAHFCPCCGWTPAPNARGGTSDG